MRTRAPRGHGDDAEPGEFAVDTSAYVLAVIEHAIRRIRILGVTAHPNDAWVTQMARNLLMDIDGQVESIKFLLRDRDTKFTAAFDTVFTAPGSGSCAARSRHPVRTPSWNAGSAAADTNSSTRR